MKKSFLLFPLCFILMFFFLSCENLETPETASAPLAPSDLVADELTSATVKLTWSDNSNNETGFTLQRSLSDSFSPPVDISILRDEVSYVDKELATDSTYYYRILASNGTLLSQWSNSATAELLDIPVPSAPSNLDGTVVSATSLDLTWTDNSDDETSFSLEYDDEDSFTDPQRITIDADSTSYSLTALQDDTTYYLRLTAVNGGGNSERSNVITLTLPEGTTVEPDSTVVEINFTDGIEWSSGQKAYAIWIANEAEDFYQNVFICNRINLQNLTGTAMPHWEDNFRSHFTEDEIDALTGPTVQTGNFTNSITLSDNSITEFDVFFEVDHSWNGNDWFSDQPAVTFMVHIDLDDLQSAYTMEFAGWTPNENTSGGDAGGVDGVFNNVLGYINKLKVTETGGTHSFGADEPKPASDLVGDLTVVINP